MTEKKVVYNTEPRYWLVDSCLFPCMDLGDTRKTDFDEALDISYNLEANLVVRESSGAKPYAYELMTDELKQLNSLKNPLDSESAGFGIDVITAIETYQKVAESAAKLLDGLKLRLTITNCKYVYEIFKKLRRNIWDQIKNYYQGEARGEALISVIDYIASVIIHNIGIKEMGDFRCMAYIWALGYVPVWDGEKWEVISRDHIYRDVKAPKRYIDPRVAEYYNELQYFDWEAHSTMKLYKERVER